MTHGPWRLIHHEENDVMELRLDSPEGKEAMWITYEEMAKLKELLSVVCTCNLVEKVLTPQVPY